MSNITPSIIILFLPPLNLLHQPFHMLRQLILHTRLLFQLILQHRILLIQALRLRVHNILLLNRVNHVLVLGGLDLLDLLLVLVKLLLELAVLVLFVLELLEGSEGVELLFLE